MTIPKIKQRKNRGKPLINQEKQKIKEKAKPRINRGFLGLQTHLFWLLLRQGRGLKNERKKW